MVNDYIYLAGYPVLNATQDALVENLHQRMQAQQKTLLFYANTNFIVQCRPLLPQLNNTNVIIVNDGVGMDIAAYLLHGKKFTSNLNGTDFSPYFLKQAKKPYRVFLLGGKLDVLNKAAYFLVHQLGQQIVGSCDGYIGMQNGSLIKQINDSNPDIVLVAMGNPLQEQWILNNYQHLNAKLFSGVGALFDFWAGNKPRAPKLFQSLRLEWFYRLTLEPKRLLKRYTVGIITFLYLCYKYKNVNIK